MQEIRIESVVDKAAAARFVDASSLQTLWNTDFTAGVYVPLDGQGFILAESCLYEPRGTITQEGEEAPFDTDGEQLLVDLSRNRFSTREIAYHEGEIQGLVYALEAIYYGGQLEPRYYHDFIQRMTRDMRDADTEWTTLPADSTQKLRLAGFVIDLAVVTQRSVN